MALRPRDCHEWCRVRTWDANLRVRRPLTSCVPTDEELKSWLAWAKGPEMDVVLAVGPMANCELRDPLADTMGLHLQDLPAHCSL